MKTRRYCVAGLLIFLIYLIGSSGCTFVPTATTITPSPAPISPTLPPSETPSLVESPTPTLLQEPLSPSTHPIVIYPPYESRSGYLLGGTLDGNWLDSTAIASDLIGGEAYSLYSDTAFLGTSTGSAPVAGAPYCPWIKDVTLDPQPRQVSVVALAGDWNPLPRIPQEISTENWIYLQAVKDLLEANDIGDSKVQLTRVLKIDLEGDGVDEILVAASYFYEETGHNITPGDYSIVVLRKVMGNEVVTLPMPADFYYRAQQYAMPEKYTIMGVMDLNGDDRMEILVGVTGWEKVGTLVYDVVDFKVQNVLSMQCP